MPKLTTRSEFQTALKSTERDMKRLFDDLLADLTALLMQYTDSSGAVPINRQEQFRVAARELVYSYFVEWRTVPASERKPEEKRLMGMIEMARKRMKTATQREQTVLRVQIQALTRRLARLQQRGQVAVAINPLGNGASPFAEVLMARIRGLVSNVTQKHASIVKKYANSPTT